MPVVLLSHCDGTNGSTTFTDTSRLANIMTATSATVTTTSPKFGTGSADLSSSGAARIALSSSAFSLGPGQFTVEAWVWFTSSPSGNNVVMSQWGGGSNNSWLFYFNGGRLWFYWTYDGSSASSQSGSYAPTLNTWIHLAVDRDAANTVRVYANGVVLGSGTGGNAFYTSTQSILIGNTNAFTDGFPGHIDEVRVVTGTAMYGGAFTPPSAPFPDPGASPIVDGFAVTGTHSGGGALVTAALTTTLANDIIIVVSSCENGAGTTPSVSSVTGGSLTFARRSSAPGMTSGGPIVETWWALAASPLSAVAFTVNYSATYDDAAAIAFAVAFCNTTTPWDGNASLPKLWQGNSAAPSFAGVSTTSANDLLLMALGANSNTTSFTEAAGFSVIGNVLNGGGTLYAWAHASGNPVTTQQSSVTFTSSTSLGSYASGSVDALTADAAGGGAAQAQARAMVLA